MKYKKYLLLIPFFLLVFFLARPFFSAQANPGKAVETAPKTQTTGAARSNAIADGVWVGSLNLSGKTLTEAAEAVEKYLTKIKNTVLTLNVYNNYANRDNPSVTDGQELINTLTVPLKDLGLSLSTDDILRQAGSFGQTGMLVERYKHLQDMRFDKVDLFPEYTIRQDAVKSFVTNKVCPEVDRGATDAEFTFSPPSVNITRRESVGIKVDVDETVKTIMALFEDGIPEKPSCSATVSYEDPKVTAESAARMTSVLGEFSTTLWDMEDHYNRTQNIILMMKILNGTVVMPGEVFSIWGVHGGDTTKEKGYLPAGTFNPTGSSDEDGGGVCQACTTIYGALLRSELEIVQRNPHSRVVGYVPYGQDAALYYPYKDLKFRNDTDAPVYVQTYVQGNQVVCRLYGHDTRPAGRSVKFVSPEDEMEMTLYGPIYSFNRSANPGVPKVEGSRSYAVVARTYKEIYMNGKLVDRFLLTEDDYNGLRQTVTIACNMYEIHQREEVKGFPKLYNKDGNQLLVNNDGVPFYDGAGGYLLVKDYQADADGHAKLSGGKPIPKPGVVPPTSEVPTTAPTSTEAPTTPTVPPTTEAPTAPTAPVLVTSITVTPGTLELDVAQTASLSAAVGPDNAANKAFNWTTSDPDVATVDGRGTVTAVAGGTATIYATAQDGSSVSGSCSVTVKAAQTDPQPPAPPMIPAGTSLREAIQYVKDTNYYHYWITSDDSNEFRDEDLETLDLDQTVLSDATSVVGSEQNTIRLKITPVLKSE